MSSERTQLHDLAVQLASWKERAEHAELALAEARHTRSSVAALEDRLSEQIDQRKSAERALADANGAIRDTADHLGRVLKEAEGYKAQLARAERERDGFALEIEGWKQKNRRDNEYLIGQRDRAEQRSTELDAEVRGLIEGHTKLTELISELEQRGKALEDELVHLHKWLGMEIASATHEGRLRFLVAIERIQAVLRTPSR